MSTQKRGARWIGWLFMASGFLILVLSYPAFQQDRCMEVWPQHGSISPFQSGVFGGLFIILGLTLLVTTRRHAERKHGTGGDYK